MMIRIFDIPIGNRIFMNFLNKILSKLFLKDKKLLEKYKVIKNKIITDKLYPLKEE